MTEDEKAEAVMFALTGQRDCPRCGQTAYNPRDIPECTSYGRVFVSKSNMCFTCTAIEIVRLLRR